MNEGTPRNIMLESNNLPGSQRRRSPRFSAPPAATTGNKMASVAVKRSITVRKIAPRKTAAPSEHNKENTPRRSEEKKTKVSTLSPVLPGRGGSSSAKKKKAAVLSPVLPSSPPASPHLQQPEDAVWSQKVRRSYSRLSGDKSLSSPDSRDSLFGFEKLQTPEVVRRVEWSKTGLEVSSSAHLNSGLNSFTSLLEADDNGSAFPELDLNIPGVSLVKEKRRRQKKVQQIGSTELDALAAQMNAEFEEAEDFELIVE